MTDPHDQLEHYLALVIGEAERDLISWTRDHLKLALRVFPDDRALGPADRQLASDVLIIMRTGEELEPPILHAYAIDRPFALEPGNDLPVEYPRLAARENYWTANLHELPDYPAWWVLTQDVEARSEELLDITPADIPPAIWIDAAVDRWRRLSPEP